MKLKIVNETDYRTADLRKLVMVAFREEGVNLKERWGTYVVKFYRLRENACYTGWGQLNAPWMRIGLHQPVSGNYLAAPEVMRVARTLVHELGHNRGLNHKDMVASCMLPVPWSEWLVIRKKIVTPKPVRDIQAERQKHAEKLLATHEAKLKREQKLVKKWRQKVRYYGRVFEQRKAADKA